MCSVIPDKTVKSYKSRIEKEISVLHRKIKILGELLEGIDVVVAAEDPDLWDDLKEELELYFYIQEK